MCSNPQIIYEHFECENCDTQTVSSTYEHWCCFLFYLVCECAALRWYVRGYCLPTKYNYGLDILNTVKIEQAILLLFWMWTVVYRSNDLRTINVCTFTR